MIVLRGDRVRQLIPKNVPLNQTEDYVCKALEHYQRYLLYEYYYDDSKKVRNQVIDVLDGLNYEVEDTVVSRITVKEKS